MYDIQRSVPMQAGSSVEVSRRNMDPSWSLLLNEDVNLLLKVGVKDIWRAGEGCCAVPQTDAPGAGGGGDLGQTPSSQIEWR